MNNTLSTALVIVGVLWLVRDLNALERTRKSHHGKSDFFFDDPFSLSQNTTPPPNAATNSKLQRIFQSSMPEEKGEDISEKAGDNKNQDDNQSLLGKIDSLSDVWKLLQHVMSLLNPIISGEADPINKSGGKSIDGSAKSGEYSASTKESQIGNGLRTHSGADIDDFFQAPLEYASGNDSYDDDEDNEEIMNFTSPNPPISLTSQLLYDGGNVTPKSVNQDITERNGLNKTSTKKSVESKNKLIFDIPNMTEETIPSNEFIDDYNDSPPKNIPAKNRIVTSSVFKDNETKRKLPNQIPSKNSISDRKNEILNDTETPSSTRKNDTVTYLVPRQNKTGILSKNCNRTKLQVPDQDTSEENKNLTKETLSQKTPTLTENPNFTGQDGKPEGEDDILKSTLLEKDTNIVIQNFDEKLDTENSEATEVLENVQKNSTKPASDKISTNLQPQKKDNNFKDATVVDQNSRFLTEIQFLQQENANPIKNETPPFLVNPLKHSYNESSGPTKIAHTFNNTKILTPTNQFNGIKYPFNKKHNNSKLFMAQNKTSYSPFLNQFPTIKPFLFRNQTLSSPFLNQSPSMKTFIPENQNSSPPFLNQFPRIKAFRPQNQFEITKLPLLQNTFNSTREFPFQNNCNNTGGIFIQDQFSNLGKLMRKGCNSTGLLTPEIDKARGENSPGYSRNVISPQKVQQSTKSTNYSPDEVAEQQNSEDILSGDLDNNDSYSRQENTSEESDDNTDATDDEADDIDDETYDDTDDDNREDNEDDTYDSANDTYDNTNDNDKADDNLDNTDDQHNYYEEVNNSNVFNNFREVASSSMAQWTQDATSFDSKKLYRIDDRFSKE